jgi:hypothetical protein
VINENEWKEQAVRAFESYYISHLRSVRKQRPYYTKASARKNAIEWFCNQLQIMPKNFKVSLSEIETCKRVVEIFRSVSNEKNY